MSNMEVLKQKYIDELSKEDLAELFFRMVAATDSCTDIIDNAVCEKCKEEHNGVCPYNEYYGECIYDGRLKALDKFLEIYKEKKNG